MLAVNDGAVMPDRMAGDRGVAEDVTARRCEAAGDM